VERQYYKYKLHKQRSQYLKTYWV